ncbi:hypothetical protein ACQY0O_000875 [Thecaphora frezii]
MPPTFRHTGPPALISSPLSGSQSQHRRQASFRVNKVFGVVAAAAAAAASPPSPFLGYLILWGDQLDEDADRIHDITIDTTDSSKRSHPRWSPSGLPNPRRFP